MTSALASLPRKSPLNTGANAFTRSLPLILLSVILSAQGALASGTCEEKAWNATVGLSNLQKYSVTATAFIASKKTGTDGKTVILTLFTDYHVVTTMCFPQKPQEGDSCKMRINFAPTNCPHPGFDVVAPVKLLRSSIPLDLAVAEIEIPSNPNFVDLSCLKSLNPELHPQMKEKIVRIGYNQSRQKLTTGGTFEGFAESIRYEKNANPGTFMTLISNTQAELGNCGGPVVSERTCSVIAVSRLWYRDSSNSGDIPIEYFSKLLESP